jgi:streptogramin lyase
MRILVTLVCSLALVGAGLAGSPPIPRETHVVVTGKEPCGIAGRGATIWIGVYAPGRLIAVDARTARITRSIRVGPTACRVSLDANAAWVALDRPGNVVRVDLRSGRKRVAPVGTGAFDVLRAHGFAWAPSFEMGTVTLLHPRTGEVARVVRVGDYPTGLESCGGRVWVGHGREATWLTSVDPRTLRVRRIPVGATDPRRPRCIRGVLWVATPDSIVQLDPSSGRVLGRVRIGETLGDLAAAPDGLVWVTDKQHSVVYRIDPNEPKIVDSFSAGPAAFALARTGNTMWVTSYAGSDVRGYTATP